MSKNIYIAAIEAGSGKSLAVLGVMDLISKNVSRIGFFRPIVRSRKQTDAHIRMIAQRFNLPFAYEEMYGVCADEMHDFFVGGRLDEVQKVIMEKFRALEKKSDFVVCEGTDFTGQTAPFEFDLNARIANNLGCPIMAVINGDGKTADEVLENILLARETFHSAGCTTLAVIVNRCRRVLLDETAQLLAGRVQEPVYLIPEEPNLRLPNMQEIERALSARRVYGADEDMMREIRATKIAAMNVPNFLNYLEENDLIITPADRSDVIIGSFMAFISANFPRISGILLTGKVDTAPSIVKLIKGLDRTPLAVLKVSTDTYSTAVAVNSVRTVMTPENEKRNLAALALFDKYVDNRELKERINVQRSLAVTPLMFEFSLIERCRANKKHIVLCEGEEERILRAAEILRMRDVVDLTLLGNEQAIRKKITALDLNLRDVQIINPVKSPWLEDFSRTYYELRKHKGISEQAAADLMIDVSYFGTMMVYKGYADGMVSGAVHTTQHTVRPALEFIKTRRGSIVSSMFFMCLADRVLVYADCAVVTNPNEQELADIAIQSAETAKMFGIEPRIAMLSYSTGESGKGKDVDKVREATRIAREHRPDLPIDGPLQYDAAVDAGVARTKLPDSKVAGQATVFIFPDLNTGNNTYKAVQRSANAVAIGPVLQGLRKPVNDLSRGSTVADIVNTVAITAIQAQALDKVEE